MIGSIDAIEPAGDHVAIGERYHRHGHGQR